MTQTTTTNKKINWIKLTGLALLLHIVLIIISIIEVFIYSMLISPGKDEAFYQGHAEMTGPWISGIFGSLFIFLLVRRFIRKHNVQHLTYTIAFPLVYIILDILMLIPFHINWSEHFPVFLMANGAKVISSFLSYFMYKGRLVNHEPQV